MNKQNYRHIISWILAGISGLVIFLLFFDNAFPIASIDLNLSKEEIVKKAEDFVNKQGYDLEGYDRSILFDSQADASIYLQKSEGMKKSNELIRQGIPVWFWSIRWFRELEKEGFYCQIDPAEGKITYFEHYLLDDVDGENLDESQARKLAEEKLSALGRDLSDYELKQSNSKVLKNRTDYYYEWEKKDFKIGEATLRLNAAVQGNKLGRYGYYLYIPEDFSRQLQKDLSQGQALSIITAVFMFLFLIAAIVVLLIRFKQDKVNWKFGLGFGLVVIVVSLLDFGNNIPLLWFSYPDTMSKLNFLAIAAGGAVIGALLIGLIIFLFGSSGHSLADEMCLFNMPVFQAIKNKRSDFDKTLPVLVSGYGLGFGFLGYITLFYLVGTRFFNIWMPPEAGYSNILGTSMPFLFPLTIALTASVSEEFMFRLFGISFFKKYIKIGWLAVLIPAVVWAFAHSNYPVFPAYVRGIELTVAGVVFGVVFLQYGLEAVLITHFVIDAALVALPLLKSKNIFFMGSGLIVLLVMFLPLLMVLLNFKKQKSNIKKRIL